MGEDPRDIERRIEDTREQMGDTVQALPAETGGGAGGPATEKARRGAGMAKENPLGLGVGSIAAGFVIGVLLPTSRAENARLGPIANQFKDQVRDVGGEAVEHGKQVAQE